MQTPDRQSFVNNAQWERQDFRRAVKRGRRKTRLWLECLCRSSSGDSQDQRKPAQGRLGWQGGMLFEGLAVHPTSPKRSIKSAPQVLPSPTSFVSPLPLCGPDLQHLTLPCYVLQLSLFFLSSLTPEKTLSCCPSLQTHHFKNS